MVGGVAQGLEQAAHNRLVVGSIPTAPTMPLLEVVFCYPNRIATMRGKVRTEQSVEMTTSSDDSSTRPPYFSAKRPSDVAVGSA